MVAGLLGLVAATFAEADAVETRPELHAVVSSFLDRGYDCSETSPEGYTRWCSLVLYPRPSMTAGLGCDGTLVSDVSLRVMPVGDSPILEVPDELRQAFDDPALQLPAEAAAWLEGCVAATGAEAVPPDGLQLDHVGARCMGTRTAPAVFLVYRTREGRSRAAARPCRPVE